MAVLKNGSRFCFRPIIVNIIHIAKNKTITPLRIASERVYPQSYTEVPSMIY